MRLLNFAASATILEVISNNEDLNVIAQIQSLQLSYVNSIFYLVP